MVIYRDEARWFAGRAVEPTSQFSSDEGKAYRIAGPWWYFENLTYLQGGDGRVFLNRGKQGGRLRNQDTAKMMRAIVNYVISAGAPISLGTIDASVQPPAERADNITCAEALLASGRWLRDAGHWWDYSATPHPQIHWRRSGNMPALTLSMSALTRLDVRPNYAQRTPFVAIRLRFTDSSDNVSVETAIFPAVPPTFFGGLDVTMDVQDGFALAAADELAAAIYQSANANLWAGSCVWSDESGEPHPTAHPGMRLSITGSGNVAWDTMRAIVQRVTDDLVTGETTFEYGPCERLGPQDLLDLLRSFRRREPTSDDEQDPEPGDGDEFGDSNSESDVSDSESDECCLPPGNEGDVLYHDGERWVVLPPPGAGARNYVLTHAGTGAPFWDFCDCDDSTSGS